jgi:hypothetical protein
MKATTILLAAILCVLLVWTYVWFGMPNPFARDLPDQPAKMVNGQPQCPKGMLPMHIPVNGVWQDICQEDVRSWAP